MRPIADGITSTPKCSEKSEHFITPSSRHRAITTPRRRQAAHRQRPRQRRARHQPKHTLSARRQQMASRSGRRLRSGRSRAAPAADLCNQWWRGHLVASVRRSSASISPRVPRTMSAVSGVIDLGCSLHPANETLDPDHGVLDSPVGLVISEARHGCGTGSVSNRIADL
jgi:hypothetical protein